MDNQSEQEEIIFGKNTVLAFLNDQAKAKNSTASSSLHHVNKIFICSSMRPDPRLAEIKRLAGLSSIPVMLVDRRKIDRMVTPESRHQGVIAKISQAEVLVFDKFIETIKQKPEKSGQTVTAEISLNCPALVIVDGIEDPHNLGAIVRVAESAGFMALLLPIRRAASISAIVAKSSAGATAHLPIVSIGNIVNVIETLKSLGFWIVGLTPEAKQSYFEADLVRPMAFVIGGEGHGISRLVKEHCDFLVSIPMLGKTESLNASVAAGVVFYEFVRQSRKLSGALPAAHNSKH